MWFGLAVLLVSFVIPLPGAGVGAYGQCEYQVTTFVQNLPCEPIGPVHVRFYGINEHGQACGSRGKCTINIDHNTPLPVVWTEELGLVTLPLPPGATNGVAHDINNVLGSDGFGQVACTLVFTSLSGNRACLYNDGTWTVLDSENSNGLTEAFAINDDGWVTGYRDSVEGRQAFRWRGKEIEQIGSPISDSAIGQDINEFAGVAGRFGSDGLGFLWDYDRVTLIPLMNGGISGEGIAINQDNRVAGQGLFQRKRTDPLVVRSFLFDGVVAGDIGVLPTRNFTRALAINDANQIVGYCHNQGLAGIRPFISQDGVITNLRDLYATPPSLTIPRDINNHGQIAGDASNGGMILTPVVQLGDIDLNCEVDGWDLALVLGNWGPCDGVGSCISDIVTSATFQPPPDGVVDGADLAVVLGNWTESSSTSLSPRR